uniref:Glycosyltransferase family 92 protein n=1 Tax=Panagrellus redivivus TaxID=6233 RepID=A0A7E4VKH2_PANRE
MPSLRRPALLFAVCGLVAMLTFLQTSEKSITYHFAKTVQNPLNVLYFEDMPSPAATEEAIIQPYKRHELTRNINCAAYFQNSSITPLPKIDKRIKVSDKDNIDLSCEAIQSRGYYPNSTDQDDYPIAFARVVYKDYQFQEVAFRADFAPNNVFCYTIDTKAKPEFVDKLLALAKCFPDNIVIAKEKFDVLQNGKNMIAAHLACLNELASKNYNYVFLLQNSDMKSKTNPETVEILKILNGTNDVSALHASPRHINPKADYSLKGLAIFRNATLNQRKTTPKGRNIRIHPTKSFVQSIISRQAVDYIQTELDLTKFIKRLESNPYGFDEGFFGTLNNNPTLNLPGGYTHECLEKNIEYEALTRLTLWENIEEMNKKCHSRKFRHTLCIYGLEDLFFLDSQPHTVVNKFLSEFDFGAIDCMAERMHNRTYYGTPGGFDLSTYADQPHVIYNRMKQEGRANEFKCFNTNITSRT